MGSAALWRPDVVDLGRSERLHAVAPALAVEVVQAPLPLVPQLWSDELLEALSGRPASQADWMSSHSCAACWWTVSVSNAASSSAATAAAVLTRRSRSRMCVAERAPASARTAQDTTTRPGHGDRRSEDHDSAADVPGASAATAVVAAPKPPPPNPPPPKPPPPPPPKPALPPPPSASADGRVDPRAHGRCDCDQFLLRRVIAERFSRAREPGARGRACESALVRLERAHPILEPRAADQPLPAPECLGERERRAAAEALDLARKAARSP